MNEKEIDMLENAPSMWENEEERASVMNLINAVGARNAGTYDADEYAATPITNTAKEYPWYVPFPDIQEGIGLGVGKAIDNAFQLGYDALNALDDFTGLDLIDGDFTFDYGKNAYEPKTRAGELASGVTQFLVGFTITGLAGKAVGVGKLMPYLGKALKTVGLGEKTLTAVTAMARGAVTDAAFFDPYEERVSNLVESSPALSNAVTAYLAANPNDSSAEGRFKNALEGIALGAATEAVFKSVKWLAQLSKGKQAGLKGKKLFDSHFTAFTEAQEAVAKAAETMHVPHAAANAATEESVLDSVSALHDVFGRAVKEPNNKQAVSEVHEVITTIRSNAEIAGIDIDRPIKELHDIVEHFVNGDINTKEATETIGAAVRNLNDMLGIKPVKEVNGRALGEVDITEVVKKYVRGVRDGIDVSDSKGLKYIRNNSESPFESVQHAFHALETSESFVRDRKNIKPESFDTLRKKAREVVGGWARRSKAESEAMKFLDAAGEAADGFSTMVAVAEGIVDDLGQQVAAYLNTFTGANDEIIAANINKEGADLLRAFAYAASRYDSLMTGFGRALNAGKLKHTVDLSEIMNAAKGASSEMTRNMQEGILKNMSDGDILVALRRISEIGANDLKVKALLPDDTGKRFMASANEYWLACVLSSGQSQANSLMSGFFKTTLFNPAEKMLISGYRYLKNGSKWANDIDKELWYEGSKAWSGVMFALKDSWNLSKIAFKYDQNLLKPSNPIIETRARIYKQTAQDGVNRTVIQNAWDAFSNVMSVPLRLLGMGDEFVSQLAYRQHLYGKLYAKGDALFAKGVITGIDREEAIQKFILSKFDSMLLDIHTSDDKVIKNAVGLLESGIREATDATYTATLPDGFMKDVQRMANEHPLFQRLIATFVRSTSNIMFDVGLHTPIVANNMRIYKDAMRTGGRQAALMQGKLALGSFAWLTGAALLLNGNITGGGSGTERSRKLDTGWRPYSMKFGGTYISYGRVEPFGTIFGLIADAGEIFETLLANDAEDEVLDQFMGVMGQVSFATIRTVTSKSFLKNMSDFVNATSTPEFAKSYVKNQALTYVPLSGALNSVRRLVDPEVREARTLLETFKARTPILSNTLPQSYSPLTGEPMHYTGGRQTAINPYPVETTVRNEVAEELLKFKKSAFMPTDRIGGIKLSPEQKSFYFKTHGSTRIGGKTLMETLQHRIDSHEYDKGRGRIPDSDQPNTGHRYKIIESTVEKYREKAVAETLKEFPELAEKVYGNTKQGHVHQNARRSMQKRPSESINEHAKAIANL